MLSLPLGFWGSGNWHGLWGSRCLELPVLAWPPIESESSAGVVGWDMELRGGCAGDPYKCGLQ